MKVLFLLVFLLAGQPRSHGIGPDPGAYVQKCVRLAILRGIEGVPDSLMPSGYDELLIVPEEDFFTDPILHLVGAGADTTDLGLIEYGGMYNPAKTDWFWDEESELVKVFSQMPGNAYTFWAEYSLQGTPPALVLLEEGTVDPSQDAVTAAWSLVDQGMISQAIDTLYMIFYPQNYYEPEAMGAALLAKSHELALRFSEEGDITAACSVMTAVFEHDYLFELDYDWILNFDSAEGYRAGDYSEYMPFEEALVIANDYGFFLLEAGRPEEAEVVLRCVVTVAPDRVVARLNLADALWALGRFDEARPQYARYLRLLEMEGLLDHAPSHALERSGS
jgi:hypothetical protein